MGLLLQHQRGDITQSNICSLQNGSSSVILCKQRIVPFGVYKTEQKYPQAEYFTES